VSKNNTYIDHAGDQQHLSVCFSFREFPTKLAVSQLFFFKNTMDGAMRNE